jgi:hypothetical protein
MLLLDSEFTHDQLAIRRRQKSEFRIRADELKTVEELDVADELEAMDELKKSSDEDDLFYSHRASSKR